MYNPVAYCFFSCFFLYSTVVLSKYPPNIDDIIQKEVTVQISKNDDCIVDVNFKNTVNCKICTTHYSKNKQFSIDKRYALYTVMSCKFANWTLYEICKFFKNITEFGLGVFDSNTPEISYPKMVFYESFIIHFKSVVAIKIERFINILNDYLDERPNSSYYFDTLIIETLASLHLHFKYLPTKTELTEHFGKTYSNINRIFLKHLTALQSVLLLNCAYSSSIPVDNNKKSVFWYWIYTDETVDRDQILNFLSSINDFEIEADRPSYATRQTFLEMYENDTTGNIVSPDTKVNVNQNDQSTVTVSDVLYCIRETCDVDLILCYQNFLLTAMAKSFFKKFANFLQQNRDSTMLRKDITRLNDVISDDRNSLPVYLPDGFSILVECVTETEPPIEELENFSETLGTIGVRENEPLSSEQFECVDYLRDTLSTIAEKVSDLQLLLHKSRKSLLAGHYAHFTMHQCNFIPVLFPLVNTEVEHFERVCKFITIMHKMCYKCLWKVREEFDTLNFADESENYNNVILRTLTKVQYYFNILLRHMVNDVYLLKMALKIMPLVVNLLNRSINDFAKNTTLRVLDVIITQLKHSGIHYCTPSETSSLLYDSIGDLDDLDKETFYIEMLDFFDPKTLNLYSSGSHKIVINSNMYKYFDLKHFYTNHISESNVYKSYENTIKVYWKGQLTTIGDVYQDVSMFLFNPYNFYALRDIAYKFYVAVVYYEIIRISTRSNLEKIKHDIENELSYFNSDYFPQILNPLIDDIKEFLMLPNYHLGNDTLALRYKLRIKIDEQFNKFNIFFPDNPSSSSCLVKTFKSLASSFTPKINDDLQLFKILNDELLKNVKSILHFKEFSVRN